MITNQMENLVACFGRAKACLQKVNRLFTNTILPKASLLSLTIQGGQNKIATRLHLRNGVMRLPDIRGPLQEVLGTSQVHPLGQIIELHIEETISDHQVERVLAPVLDMVRRSAYDVPQRPEAYEPPETPKSRSLQYPYLLTATAMVAVVVVALFSNLQGMRHDYYEGEEDAKVEVVEFLEIPTTSIPLSGTEIIRQVLPGFVGDLSDVELGVANAQGHLLGLAGMEGGAFRFDHLPDGNFRALALLPGTHARIGGIEIGSLIVTNGTARLVLSEGLENFWEGADIQIWITGSG